MLVGFTNFDYGSDPKEKNSTTSYVFNHTYVSLGLARRKIPFLFHWKKLSIKQSFIQVKTLFFFEKCIQLSLY